jgi:hypothetical protein
MTPSHLSYPEPLQLPPSPRIIRDETRRMPSPLFVWVIAAATCWVPVVAALYLLLLR